MEKEENRVKEEMRRESKRTERKRWIKREEIVSKRSGPGGELQPPPVGVALSFLQAFFHFNQAVVS